MSGTSRGGQAKPEVSSAQEAAAVEECVDSQANACTSTSPHLEVVLLWNTSASYWF